MWKIQSQEIQVETDLWKVMGEVDLTPVDRLYFRFDPIDWPFWLFLHAEPHLDPARDSLSQLNVTHKGDCLTSILFIS